ncbi:hypothetical protein PspLS_07022 [Pyricularia sp. CBS 133598]|nr:hypothetical protein PspLS_07022 [Pyricularia sp. CBS 133598]
MAALTAALVPTSPRIWSGGIDQYIADNAIICAAATPIEAGRSCYIWRLDGFPGHSSPVVLKCADNTPKASDYFVCPDRLSNEVRALDSPAVADACAAVPSVRVPRVLRTTTNGFVMTWAGSTNLLDALRAEAAIDVEAIGGRIGKWLGSLHVAAADAHGFPEVNSELERNFFCAGGFMDKLVQAAIPDAGESDGILAAIRGTSTVRTLTSWDFRPMNTLLTLDDSTGTKDPVVHVVDWELAHHGEAAWDVGMWTVEAWVAEDKHGDRGMLTAFLTAYKARVAGEGFITDGFLCKLAMVVGVMLMHFMRIAQKLWGCDEEDVARWRETAAGYLRAGSRRDMKWLAEGRLRAVMA